MHYNMHIEAYACYNESGGHTRMGAAMHMGDYFEGENSLTGLCTL